MRRLCELNGLARSFVALNIVGWIFEPLRRHMKRMPTALVESVVHTDRNAAGSHEHLTENTNGAQLIYRASTHGLPKTESHHVQRWVGRNVTAVYSRGCCRRLQLSTSCSEGNQADCILCSMHLTD